MLGTSMDRFMVHIPKRAANLEARFSRANHYFKLLLAILTVSFFLLFNSV